MVALTRVRSVVVQNYDELNQILADIQIDEDANIVHVSTPKTLINIGMVFQIQYHIKNLERERSANTNIEEVTQESSRPMGSDI